MIATMLLDNAEIAQQLTTLPGWKRTGDVLVKEYILGGFTAATQFVARIAPIADAMDHHPDVFIHRYKRVRIILTTHSAGGLTPKDLELAAKIEALEKT